MSSNLFFFFNIRKVPLISPLLVYGFCVGHDVFSSEGVLTSGLDVLE